MLFHLFLLCALGFPNVDLVLNSIIVDDVVPDDVPDDSDIVYVHAPDTDFVYDSIIAGDVNPAHVDAHVGVV